MMCKLYCIHAAKGEKLWEFATKGHTESSPRVIDGRVYFGAGDDGLYCVDAITGEELGILKVGMLTVGLPWPTAGFMLAAVTEPTNCSAWTLERVRVYGIDAWICRRLGRQLSQTQMFFLESEMGASCRRRSAGRGAFVLECNKWRHLLEV